MAGSAKARRGARAFLNKGAHGGQIGALFAGFFAARVECLQLGVTAHKKMLQAKSLLIEGSSRGARASSLAAIPFCELPIHRTPAW